MKSAIHMNSDHINSKPIDSMLTNTSDLEDVQQNMQLLPLELPNPLPHFDDVYFAANSFAASQGYALVKKRTKKSKKGIFRKRVVICDKGNSYKPAGTEKRESSNRSCECPFEAVITLQENGWVFRVSNPNHNHPSTLPGSHPIHRDLAMNNALKKMVETQTRMKNTSAQIIINIRLQHAESNPLIKLKDIYNMRMYWRQEILRNLTSTQALLRELVKSDQ